MFAFSGSRCHVSRHPCYWNAPYTCYTGSRGYSCHGNPSFLGVQGICFTVEETFFQRLKSEKNKVKKNIKRPNILAKTNLIVIGWVSDQNKNTKIISVKYWKKVALCESATKLFSSQWLHQRNLSKDYRSVTLDVTAAMLVLYHKNPAGNELLSMEKISFVPGNLHGCWPRDWKWPIKRYHRKLLLRFRPQTQKLSFIELSHHSISEANT